MLQPMALGTDYVSSIFQLLIEICSYICFFLLGHRSHTAADKASGLNVLGMLVVLGSTMCCL